MKETEDQFEKDLKLVREYLAIVESRDLAIKRTLLQSGPDQVLKKIKDYGRPLTAREVFEAWPKTEQILKFPFFQKVLKDAADKPDAEFFHNLSNDLKKADKYPSNVEVVLLMCWIDSPLGVGFHQCTTNALLDFFEHVLNLRLTKSSLEKTINRKLKLKRSKEYLKYTKFVVCPDGYRFE